MRYPKLFLGILLLMITISTYVVSANSKTPFVSSITQNPDTKEQIINIYGKHFGHKPENVQVMVNENGSFAKIIYASPTLIQAQLSSSQICSGNIAVRVFVNKKTSNSTTFAVQPGTPDIYQIDRDNVLAGSLIEISGDNLSCQAEENLVSFNNTTVKPLSINGNALTVRVPETLEAGRISVKVTSNGLESKPLSLNIAPQPINGGNPDSGPAKGGQQFINSDAMMSAGFAPLFGIKDGQALTDGNAGLYWDASFAGTHRAVVNAPWKTITGEQQVALITINIGHSNSLVGNNTGEFEKFVYARINYPLHPELPFDPMTNPFWWGASQLATEHLPHGRIYFNSLGAAIGGVEAFSLPEIIPGKATMSLAMRLVAPDLMQYEEYGANFAKAGGGLVRLPKVTTLVVKINDSDARVPALKIQLGDVTVVDESNNNGNITTTKVRFQSDVVHVNGQTQL